MLGKLFCIFIGGIVVDLLITKYTRCVASDRAKSASILSGLITLGNLGIWGTILQDAETLGLYGAVAMALGASVGTFLGFHKRRSSSEVEPPRELRGEAMAVSVSSESVLPRLPLGGAASTRAGASGLARTGTQPHAVSQASTLARVG